MPAPVVLEGRIVRLEPLRRDHVPALLAAATEDRDSYRFAPVPADRGGMEAYVAEALTEQERGDQLPFATIDRRAGPAGRVVGSTRFRDTLPWAWPAGHPLQRSDVPDAVEIGYTWLAASAQRSGVNTEAKYLMLRHAFEVWQVHRVCLRTDVRNARSWAAIEAIGAKFEGVRRADRPGADGTVRDSAFFSIIAAEWPTVKAHLEARLARLTL